MSKKAICITTTEIWHDNLFTLLLAGGGKKHQNACKSESEAAARN